MAADGVFSGNSNAASYSQRQVTQEQLRATQEELASKVRELQIYESNYVTLKKELARWKKKFEYIFRENELLSLETAKLDASHKQIAFLQQEIKFKEEESSALRGLVSALEASNKKARAARLSASAKKSASSSALELPAAAQVLLENDANAASPSTQAGAEASSEALEQERRERGEERERLSSEISALKAENSMLLKDVDRKALALALQDDKVAAHKERIAGLEQMLQDEQDKHLAQLRDKQESIVDLELRIQQMEMRRRSSAAYYAPRPDENGDSSSSSTNSGEQPSPSKAQYPGFGPAERLQGAAAHAERADGGVGVDFDESPDTPPGTPPPISAGGLLPPVDDPAQDQVIRDWEDDRKVRAAATAAFDPAQLQGVLDKLPFEAKDGTSRLLLDALAPALRSDSSAGVGVSVRQVAESQILIQAASKATQKELRAFVIPLLKAQKTMRVTYATRERKTLVTDVRITLEPRPSSVTGVAGSGGPEEKRFGKDHAFYGPSPDDVAKLVLHGPRALSSEKKATYVSKPLAVQGEQLQRHSDELGESPTQQQAAGEADAAPVGVGGATATATATSSETMTTTTTTEPPVATRRWRGMSVQTVKLVGTMVAGARQRVTARFGNAKFVHEGSACQLCKTAPIVGPRYACATCVGFDLCEGCYALGGHGLENSDELFYRVQELALARCPRLLDEVELLELLRFEICRSNLRKFSFCLNWLADIVAGKTSRDLQARALEIPSIRRDVRKRFVPRLLVVCSDRDDIEVKTEWELESDNAAEVRSVVRGSLSDGDGRFLETLRIWVADQYRTTSPFVERNLLKYREGGGAALDEDEDDEDEDGDKGDRDEAADKKQQQLAAVADGAGKPPLAQKKSSSSKQLQAPEAGGEDPSAAKGFLERNRIQNSVEF
ncbi:hypothetical protein PybrP1_003949 [[Pythium] brassicae (nom. inval.)]|nr:hypothetical protein PybrP1_003949 [[Pythium] brassicae (nom. inval.)]